MLLVFAVPTLARAQAGFTYTTNNGTITINTYQGPGGAVVIPASINGLPVTRILASPFSGREVTSVTIPASVTTIIDGAFTSCPSLAEITVDALNSVYGSVDGVLFNKSQSTLIQYPGGKAGSYSIPTGVTRIEKWAFRDCATLTSVTIPGSLNSIGADAFMACWGLRAVYFQGDAPAIDARAFESTLATLFYLPGSVGWEEILGGRPTVQWNGTLGVQAIQVHAGLSVAGESGKVYSIEYTTVQSEPAENDWRCLEFVQLPASPYQWIDISAPAREKRFYRAVEMEAPPNMVFIPPGTFLMGSPPDEVGRWAYEGPQTRVIISRGYWMGKYEVTQGEYLAVMGNNPSWFNGDHTELGYSDYGTDLTRPVDAVSWDNATAYCNALTQRDHLAGRIAPNCVYRLPTEAEWEYACRGWTSTRFSYGDDPGYTNLTNYAWYDGNCDRQPHPVGQKLPNPWGLYDMHGNVWEWCQDRWNNRLPGGIVLDRQAPATGFARVVRSGSWRSIAEGCRSADRSRLTQGSWDNDYGFRVVLAPSQP